MSDLVPAPWISDLQDFRCKDHPQRPVQSVCRGCGKPLCVECATKVDGLNRCADCVRKARPATQHSGSPPSWRILRFAGVAVTFLFFAALAAGYAVGWPLVWGMRKVNENEERLDNIRYGLHAFHDDYARWPTKKEGLKVLLEPAEGMELWDGPYLWVDTEGILDAETGDVVDVFGNPIYYWSEPDAKRAYVVSMGPDGVLNSEGLGTDSPKSEGDDHIVWTDDMSYMTDEPDPEELELEGSD